MDRGNRDTLGPGPFPIHIHVVFRDIIHAVGANRDQAGILCSQPQQLVPCFHQFFMTQAGPVLQLEIKPVGGAQFQHCRRGEYEYLCPLDPGQGAHGPAGKGHGFQIGPVPQLPVSQPDKGNTHVLTISAKTGTPNRHDGQYRFFLIFQEMVPHLVQHLLGLFQRGTHRQHDLAEHHALVFIGQVCGGHPFEQETQNDNDQQEGNHEPEPPG